MTWLHIICKKMIFFSTIGDLVMSTETTIKENISREMDKFELELATATEAEIRTLQEQAPKCDLYHERIQQLEELMQKTNDKIAELEAKHLHYDTKSNSSTHAKATAVPSQPAPINESAPASFQPFPRPTTVNQPDDNGPDPKVANTSLIDYQQGMLKLRNIRIIAAHRGPDAFWRYTAVTIHNTVVNDLKAEFMTNI